MIIIIIRMDTYNDTRMAFCEVAAEIGSRNVVVGAKQLRKALTSGTARRVFLAQNADPAITDPIEALCKSCLVDYVWVKSMTDLGRACGIEVGAAAAAVVE